MEEIKFESKKPMMEKVDELYDSLTDKKTKKIKIPRRAKVRRRKLKKGWIGVLKIDENGNITGTKEKVDGACYRESKSIRYHVTDGREILFWEGKFPIIIQPTWRQNPMNIRKMTSKKVDGVDELVNETYGHKYLLAKMLADTIKVAKKAGSIIIFIIIGAAILFGANYFFGGGTG